MQFFWVNLGTTFREVLKDKFLWAPAHSFTKSGNETIKAGWKAVASVKKGDVIFCNADKRLIYVAVAKKDAYSSPRPASRAFNEWDADGVRINVDLTVLESPVSHDEIRDEFFEAFNSLCKPMVFTVNRTVAQHYMCVIPSTAALMLFRVSEDGTTEFVSESSDSIVYGQQEGASRKATVNVRQGQALFRKKVLNYWNNTCPVTGLNIPELLTASHIIPWVLSTPKEKVDCSNGIALSPMADKLFDKGFISFDSDGVLISNGRLNDEQLLSFGIRVGLKVSGLSEKHLDKMKMHRVLFGIN